MCIHLASVIFHNVGRKIVVGEGGLTGGTGIVWGGVIMELERAEMKTKVAVRLCQGWETRWKGQVVRNQEVLEKKILGGG